MSGKNSCDSCFVSLSSLFSPFVKVSKDECKKDECKKDEPVKCAVKCPKIDCCTPQYQRLAKISTLNIIGGVLQQADQTLSQDRAGNIIAPPTTNPAFLTTSPPFPVAGIPIPAGAYNNAPGTFVPITYDRSSPLSNTLNAYLAYYLVNAVRETNSNPCDQVWGWYADTSNGNLQLFQETEGVPTNVTRGHTQTLTNAATPQELAQAKVLNKLYSLSLSAIKSVNYIPNEEGSIVQATDCNGQKWLVFINFARTFNVSAYNGSTRYIFVAAKL